MENMTTHHNVTVTEAPLQHQQQAAEGEEGARALEAHNTLLRAIKSDFADNLPTFPPDGTIRSSLMLDMMQGIYPSFLSVPFVNVLQLMLEV